jgi:hypothetical protein
VTASAAGRGVHLGAGGQLGGRAAGRRRSAGPAGEQLDRRPTSSGRPRQEPSSGRGEPLGEHLPGQPDPGDAASRPAPGVPQLAGDGAHPGPVPQPVVRALLHRDVRPGQRVHDRRRLGVGPVEHGDVGERESGRPAVDPAGVQRPVREATDQVVDGAYQEVGLVRDGGCQQGPRPAAPQVSRARSSRRPRTSDDGAMACTRGQDGRRRAVVAGQPDQPGVVKSWEKRRK